MVGRGGGAADARAIGPEGAGDVAVLNIRAFDADRGRLKDIVDVDVTDMSTMASVSRRQGVSGATAVKVSGLTPGRLYRVQVFPLRHRPVGVFERATNVRDLEVDVFCPVHPDRVTEVVFPKYANLPAALRSVLQVSRLEEHAESGVALYDGLDAIGRSGLLNLFYKMENTVVAGKTMWSFVRDVYRIRGDRIYANVAADFRDAVKSAVTGGLFEKVNGSLHTPPEGYALASSFKHTLFRAGGLQLTFFASTSAAQPGGPPSFRVDADIDDAAGLGHVFQVLRNWIGDRDTHPFDIHQILTFHQKLQPGYRLKTV